MNGKARFYLVKCIDKPKKYDDCPENYFFDGNKCILGEKKCVLIKRERECLKSNCGWCIPKSYNSYCESKNYQQSKLKCVHGWNTSFNSYIN